MICKKHFCQANGAFDDPEWDDFRCVLRKFMNFFTSHLTPALNQEGSKHHTGCSVLKRK